MSIKISNNSVELDRDGRSENHKRCIDNRRDSA